MWAKGGSDEGPLLVGHRLSRIGASGDPRYLITRNAAETLHHPGGVPPCEPRLNHDPRRMTRVAGPVEQDDRPAHRVSEENRPGYSDRIAECP
jgi:hypothetical protein